MNIMVVEVTSFIQDDEVIGRVCLNVNGHDVQVVSHDNNPQVIVKVDKQIELMHISRINQFIRSNI